MAKTRERFQKKMSCQRARDRAEHKTKHLATRENSHTTLLRRAVTVEIFQVYVHLAPARVRWAIEKKISTYSMFGALLSTSMHLGCLAAPTSIPFHLLRRASLRWEFINKTTQLCNPTQQQSVTAKAANRLDTKQTIEENVPRLQGSKIPSNQV